MQTAGFQALLATLQEGASGGTAAEDAAAGHGEAHTDARADFGFVRREGDEDDGGEGDEDSGEEAEEEDGDDDAGEVVDGDVGEEDDAYYEGAWKGGFG